MIKYFLIFGIVCLIYNALKIEVMLSGCMGGDISEIRITKMRLLEIPSVISTSIISSAFILILFLCIKSFLNWQVKPLSINSLEYERAIKEMKIILICGVVLMTLAIIRNNKEIQQFGKQILLITNKSSLVKLANNEMKWQSEIRNIWESSVITSCMLFGIRLYRKLNIRLYTSILVSIIVFFCLSIPFYEQIYQSFKIIINQ